jgi:sugar lactone lactonase YvrE
VRWAASESCCGRAFRLELQLEPAPTLRAGDLVFVSSSPHRGLVAYDFEQGLEMPLGAPLPEAGWLFGAAIDPRDGSLVTHAPALWSSLLRVDLASGHVTERPVQLPVPEELYKHHFAANADGDVFVPIGRYTGGVWGGSILRIDAETGEAQEIARDGDLAPPWGLAVEASGRLVVTAPLSGWIVRVDPSDGSQQRLSEGGLLTAPTAVAVDPGGALLVANGSLAAPDFRVVRVDPDTGTQSLAAELPFPPQAIAVAPDGTIWVGSSYEACGGIPCDARVARIDPVGGACTEVFADPLAGITGLEMGADGAPVVVLVDEHWRSRVSRIDPATGAEQVLAAPLPFGALGVEPGPIALDAERRALVGVGPFGDRVARVDPATGAQQPFTMRGALASTPAAGAEAVGMALGAGRLHLLVADPFAGAGPPRALALDLASGVQQELTPLPPDTAALAVEASGAYLTVDLVQEPGGAWASTLRRVEPVTGASTIVGQGPSLATFRTPDLSVAPDGTLVLTVDGEAWRMDPQTGALASLLPAGVQVARVDPAGRVFALDERGGLLRLDPATGALVLRRPHSTVNGSFVLVAPRCADGFDDDGDGAADWPADPQCLSRHQDSETRAGPGCGLGVELALALAALAARRRRLPPAP